jgi:hypothetical protein
MPACGSAQDRWRPILLPRDVHFLLHIYTSFHPKDNHSNLVACLRAVARRTAGRPILLPPDVHFLLHMHMYLHSMDNHLNVAHFTTSRCPFNAAFEHVLSSQGQPFKLGRIFKVSWPIAHCNTSRCP